MNFKHVFIGIPFLVVWLGDWNCGAKKQTPLEIQAAVLAEVYDLAKDTMPRTPLKSLLFTKPDSLPKLKKDSNLVAALKLQSKYLKEKSTPRLPLTGFSKREMLYSVELLRSSPTLDFKDLATYFDFYQMKTDKRKHQVRVTGYYTPELTASQRYSPQFCIPILRHPDEGTPVPSPKAIENGELTGLGLEVAWIEDRKMLANAQLQGSCILHFIEGDTMFLGYDGCVKGDGGAYVFFKPIGKKVLGAGNFELTPEHSLAVDPRYVPLGASILAELPVLNAKGKRIGKQYRILLAQDRGGAIKTTKRVDLYCGIGHNAYRESQRINGFGRFWVMLPKRD